MAPSARTSSRPEVASCTLDTEARERRLREWQALRSEALISESHSEAGSIAVFERSADVERRLEALIAAEAGCCSFLRFNVTEQDDRIVVDVTSATEAD